MTVASEVKSLEGEPVLSVAGLRKEFPGVVALESVDFDVRPGEVHALLGANGAGKSTLIKIVSSLYQPDRGEVFLEGRKVSFSSTAEAIQAGISVIYQDFALVPDLTAAENIFLGSEMRRKFGLVDRFAQRREAERLLEMVGADFSASTLVSDLGTGKRQQLEIAKALRSRAKVLILDEPTASLSHAESDRLFDVVRRLAEEGVGIVYVSHRLEEITGLVDRVTVLRDGVSVGTFPTRETDREKIVSLITGEASQVDHAQRPDRVRGVESAPLLDVAGLTCESEFRDVSFTVRPGEIVVLTGLVGAGRTEVLEAIFGARSFSEGEIWVSGEKAAIKNPQDAISAGIALIPEDRRGQGVSVVMSIGENIALPILKRFMGKLILSRRRIFQHADSLIDKLSIRTPSPNVPAGSLSGGNQQKVVLAKWLSTDAKIFLIDEPTQGVDVGAKAEIYALIESLADDGSGVLIVSSDLEEVLAVADRVLAMRSGRIVSEFENVDLPASRIVDAITNG